MFQLLGKGQRKAEGHAGAVTDARHLAAVRFHDGLDHRQTDAVPARGSVARFVGAIKALEELGMLPFGERGVVALFQHGAATLSRHTGTEAMAFRTLASVRLIGALHVLAFQNGVRATVRLYYAGSERQECF